MQRLLRDSIQNTNDCQIAIVCPPGMLVSAATRARFSIKNPQRGNDFYRRIQMIARLLHPHFMDSRFPHPPAVVVDELIEEGHSGGLALCAKHAIHFN